MRVLMTGASGFVGKRVLHFFSKLQNMEMTLLSSHNIENYNCIIHNNYDLQKNSISEKFDCLVLLGGVTPKGHGDEKESEYVENIYSAYRIIEAMSTFPSNIIYVSSVSVYNASENEVSESSELCTSQLYGLSKLVSEKYLEDKCHEYNSRFSILRLGPVYGPGEETYSKIVGYFIKQAIGNKVITIKSDGSEKRNMIYVDDVAKLIVALVCDSKEVGVVNVVSPDAISVSNLAKSVVDISNSKSEIVILNGNNGRNDLYSANRIKDIFNDLKIGFTPYEEGIKQTYYHFKENKIE